MLLPVDGYSVGGILLLLAYLRGCCISVPLSQGIVLPGMVTFWTFLESWTSVLELAVNTFALVELILLKCYFHDLRLNF